MCVQLAQECKYVVTVFNPPQILQADYVMIGDCLAFTQNRTNRMSPNLTSLVYIETRYARGNYL